MTTSPLEDDLKEVIGRQRDYWRQVAESDGFDIDDLSVPRTGGLLSVDCKHRRFRLCGVPKLYAMVGLHSYNMLKGTNFQLLELLKYNESMNCVRSFFITSVAIDCSSQSQKTFQLRIDEQSYGKLDLTVSIARPKGEEEVTTTKEPFIPHFHGEAAADDFYQGALPDWPTVDDLNNQKRFYLVKNFELQANNWIHLYLEVALCVDDEGTRESDLSKLPILKVAIETKEEDMHPPNWRLEAKSAIFYITYKGLAKGPLGEIGEHFERKAIVRRVIDERTGYLTLLGGFSSGEQLVSRPTLKRPRLE